jgi:hypothetical protein
MLVKFYGQFEQYGEKELEVENLNQLLAGLKFLCGHEFSQELMKATCYFILTKKDSPENFLPLRPDLGITDFGEFDTLLIIPEVSGDIPVPLLLIAAVSSLTGLSAATAGAALATIGNMLIATALSAVVQLISPTPEFKSDPSNSQSRRSSLFNGPATITEQGGSVPLVYGNPFCSGVVISSGLTNEEEHIDPL